MASLGLDSFGSRLVFLYGSYCVCMVPVILYRMDMGVARMTD